MDVDAGHGAALGGALPTQPGDLPLSRRLRSLLSWPTTDNDPVTALVRAHRGIHPSSDASVLRRAYTIAENMHRGQFRKSGEPYITHPLAVAQICADLGMDTTTLVAALLHDTVEDTRYTLQALQEDFGRQVAHLVDGVTKFDKAFYGKAAEAETVRKMIVAAGKDVRVLIIKLADRLHNMRTLGVRSAASRERIASKTQEVDVVLLHLHPEEHARIARFVHDRPGWDAYLDDVVAKTRAALRRSRVDAEVGPRPRHLYSIWKDTVAGEHTAPYDLPRIAIVVDGPATDCYAALGAVHGLWRPVPGRFKDFIASPKNNLYRSLHTSVCGPQDRTVEVLIRTEEMHHSAEYGVAAHYRFPRAAGRADERTDELAWLRRVLDWEQETVDPTQFMESLRCDLAEAQIQVVADGRQVVLPAGATPVDLAYELGTERGDHCLAARINGRLAPLSSELEEGDVVEIFTESDAESGFEVDVAPRGPRREWLGFVKSPHAQMQINRWFAEHTEPGISIADKVRLGRATIGLALRKHDRGLASDLPLLRLSEELGYPDLETLLVAVFDRTVEPDTVVRQLIDLVDHRQ
ncbi:hypothetical protein GCM10027452_31510 [Micromonospora halotolerans]